MNIDLMVKIRYTVDHSDFLVNVPLSLECFPRLLPDHQSDRRNVKPSRNSRVDYEIYDHTSDKTSIYSSIPANLALSSKSFLALFTGPFMDSISGSDGSPLRQEYNVTRRRLALVLDPDRQIPVQAGIDPRIAFAPGTA